jgi:catechol 2,3-dioxygenase-like lactoylglutathione lyase family enzyme
VAISWFGTMIDCRDPEHLARFWCDVLGYRVVFRSESMVAIAADPDSQPGLGFVRVSEPKQHKNRLHLDLRPDNQQTEVKRLVALGAARADIGQGDASWVVMADPEGNEFCVLAR